MTRVELRLCIKVRHRGGGLFFFVLLSQRHCLEEAGEKGNSFFGFQYNI